MNHTSVEKIKNKKKKKGALEYNCIPKELLGPINKWEIGVLAGPQSFPEYLTENDFKLIFESEYEVSHNASRLGIRLIGPKFEWSRQNGGEGGSHPSNLIDNPYSIGTINFTGDHGVILTVDGPSLGGFVCPVTIPSTQLWKIGQLKPSDTIKFKLMDLNDVNEEKTEQEFIINNLTNKENKNKNNNKNKNVMSSIKNVSGLLDKNEKDDINVEYRMAGDKHLLIEYGDMNVVDVTLRIRIHELEKALMNINKKELNDAIIETIPGVRSLLIQYEANKLPLQELLNVCKDVEKQLNVNDVVINSRIFNLPILIEDEWTLEAIDRYTKEVRPRAAYLPSNIEFICKNNGLNNIQEFKEMIYSTKYLTLGLGDVYLGAPCAIPIDPRKRLNVPKYNPSRNYTPEGAVGIGGQYMCIYGMDSPGGYQLIGRTLPIWNTKGNLPNFSEDKPWLLDMFDQVQFYPVTRQQLIDNRQDFSNGVMKLDVESQQFTVSSYNEFVKAIDKNEITNFKNKQKIGQETQLKLDSKILSELNMLKENISNCCKLLGNMIVNGPKYGVSLFLFVQQNKNVLETFPQKQFVDIMQVNDQIEIVQKDNNNDKKYKIKFISIQKLSEKYSIKFLVNGETHMVFITPENQFKDIPYMDRMEDIELIRNSKSTINGSEISLENMIFADIPGRVTKINVKKGDEVKLGQSLMVTSSMKMEQEIISKAHGIVSQIFVNVDDIFQTGEHMIEVSPPQ